MSSRTSNSRVDLDNTSAPCYNSSYAAQTGHERSLSFSLIPQQHVPIASAPRSSSTPFVKNIVPQFHAPNPAPAIAATDLLRAQKRVDAAEAKHKQAHAALLAERTASAQRAEVARRDIAAANLAEQKAREDANRVAAEASSRVPRDKFDAAIAAMYRADALLSEREAALSAAVQRAEESELKLVEANKEVAAANAGWQASDLRIESAAAERDEHRRESMRLNVENEKQVAEIASIKTELAASQKEIAEIGAARDAALALAESRALSSQESENLHKIDAARAEAVDALAARDDAVAALQVATAERDAAAEKLAALQVDHQRLVQLGDPVRVYEEHQALVQRRDEIDARLASDEEVAESATLRAERENLEERIGELAQRHSALVTPLNVKQQAPVEATPEAPDVEPEPEPVGAWNALCTIDAAPAATAFESKLVMPPRHALSGAWLERGQSIDGNVTHFGAAPGNALVDSLVQDLRHILDFAAQKEVAMAF